MSVVTIGKNRFPSTSQLSEYYVKRRFATEEIYNRYIEDIANLISVSIPEYQNYSISNEMKTALNQKVSTLETKLQEVSALYNLSDNLNYKNAEKEVAELNKIIQDTLATIKEEVDDLKYKEFEYYLKEKLIEMYSTKYKRVVNILTDNKKILEKNGTLIILGKDGCLYGIGNNESGILKVSEEYQKFIKKINFEGKIKDFALFEDKILVLKENGTIEVLNSEKEYEEPISDRVYKEILFVSDSDVTDEKKHTCVILSTVTGEIVVYTSGVFYGISIPDIDARVASTYYGDKVYVLGTKDYYYECSLDGTFVTKVNPREESGITDFIGDYLPKIIPDVSIIATSFGSSYVLDETKNLFVKGNNRYGQLGLGIDDLSVQNYTRIEKFKNGVKSILSTGDRAFLVTAKKSYGYQNDEEDEYRNEESSDEDSMLWVCGRNELNDRLIGIPTSSDINKLKEKMDEIDMSFFDNENLTISNEKQERITSLLGSKADLLAEIADVETKYSNHIKEWTKVFPNQPTNYLLTSISGEITYLISEYENLKDEIVAEQV